MAEQKAGDWLEIGGDRDGRVEVRIATGPVSWEWRTLTEEDKARLIGLWNSVSFPSDTY